MSPTRLVLTIAAILADVLFAWRYADFRKVLPVGCDWQPLCMQWRPNRETAHRSFETLQGEGRIKLAESKLPTLMLFAFSLTLCVASLNMAKISWILYVMLVSAIIGSIGLHGESALLVRACKAHPGGEKFLKSASFFAWGKWAGFALWIVLLFFCIVSSAWNL